MINGVRDSCNTTIYTHDTNSFKHTTQQHSTSFPNHSGCVPFKPDTRMFFLRLNLRIDILLSRTNDPKKRTCRLEAHAVRSSILALWQIACMPSVSYQPCVSRLSVMVAVGRPTPGTSHIQPCSKWPQCNMLRCCGVASPFRDEVGSQHTHKSRSPNFSPDRFPPVVLVVFDCLHKCCALRLISKILV